MSNKLFVYQYRGGRYWMICDESHNCEAGAHSQDIEMDNGHLIPACDRDWYQSRIDWEDHNFHQRHNDQCTLCYHRWLVWSRGTRSSVVYPND